MSSIVVGLNSTWTARWYQAASGTQRPDAWAERLRYFRALSELLTELVKGSNQPQIAPRGLVTEVARRAHFSAHETLYKRFRSEWEGPIERWARTDDAVKPRNALVAEAKIVSFWGYRGGVLRLAGTPGVTLTEVAEAYLSALASWASDDGPLAACRPAGPPACVAEDMSVLATLWLMQATPDRVIPAPRAGTHVRCEHAAEKAGQLDRLARAVVQHVLEDPAGRPGQAVDAVRDDVHKLLANPMDPLIDQLTRAATQLSARLGHAGRGEPLVTAQRARTLLAALTPLATQLREIAAELSIQNDSAPRSLAQPLRGLEQGTRAGAGDLCPAEGSWRGALCRPAVSPRRKAADDCSMNTVVLPAVHRVGGLIGAELSGLDLTRDYPDETYEAILRAWAENGVIFFRDQHLNEEQREAFASRLGVIRVKQQVRKEPEQVKAIGEGWHTDMTCFDEPPKATILFAEQVPPHGGDTQWAGMGPAFDALSEGLRRTLTGMWAVHANVRKLGYSYAQTDPPEPSIAEYDAAEGSLHPVVRLIPETGRPVLYVNPEFTTRFEGWTRRESLPLLQYLFAQGARPEFVTRFHWTPGAIAIWDNRQTWHFAVNDYQGERRVMHRILLAGHKPEPAQ